MWCQADTDKRARLVVVHNSFTQDSLSQRVKKHRIVVLFLSRDWKIFSNSDGTSWSNKITIDPPVKIWIESFQFLLIDTSLRNRSIYFCDDRLLDGFAWHISWRKNDLRSKDKFQLFATERTQDEENQPVPLFRGDKEWNVINTTLDIKLSSRIRGRSHDHEDVDRYQTSMGLEEFLTWRVYIGMVPRPARRLRIVLTKLHDDLEVETDGNIIIKAISQSTTGWIWITDVCP